MIKVEKNIAGRPLKIESGQIARQAGGSVFITYGETAILATVCCSSEPREGIDFLPMQVEYREKHYAGGKIPGGFFKREAKPTDAEVLTSRLTDRPIRPLIPKNYRHELQIMLTTMSYDGINTPDVVAAIGASAALLLSPVPFDGPIASVKVGLIDGEYVLNPTFEQMESSDLDLMVTGKKDKICMIEGGSNFVPEKTILEALDVAMDGINDIVDLQMEFSEHFDNSYEIVDTKIITEEIENSLDAYSAKIEKIFELDTKQARDDEYNAIEKEALEPFVEDEVMYPEVKTHMKNMFKNAVRKTVLDKKVRVDGRGLEDIRDISIVPTILPRVHGSALFTRGETQSIAALTLGSSRDEQIIDSMASDYKKSFLLHYNFPPYCVGETGRIGFTNRREIGHGHLAERSLKPILPSSEEFPYTIRIVSEITESNGSSSMASVCGGSLAMMNAGVPIKGHVAGIAMGLIMEDENNYAVLSDILGTEDFLGDMDFKVAGTKDGISAIQLDLKVPGLSMDVLSNALEQANKGRLHILDEMNKAIDKPNTLSPYAPQIESFQIPKDKIGALIGPGGKNIKALQEGAECVINIDDDGTVSVSAEDKAKLDNAISQIKAVVLDPEVGTIFDGKVTKILDFGAFVEFAPGREGLVHISHLSWERVNKVEDVLSEGDKVKIKLFEIDKQGRLNFSIKLLTEKPE